MDKPKKHAAETKLDEVERHVKDGERVLERQRDSIEGRRSYGHPVEPADDEMEESQRHHLEHRAPADRVGEHDPGAPDQWKGT